MIQAAPALIDLHLHTTASDGRCSPLELVREAAAAGVAVLAVTDHDTTAAVPEVRAAARELAIEAVAGIEITAVDAGRDVHLLAYFFDPADQPLQTFLAAQRAARVARVRAIGERLAALGMPVELTPLLDAARGGTGASVGRPQVARAMVEAGHVRDVREAFDVWLAQGRPACIPRTGPTPETVLQVIRRAGGLSSLAHPGKAGMDARIPALARAGLDALEAFHPDHDGEAVARYVAIARTRGLLLTGGSDYHADPARGLSPGCVTLPPDEWSRLRQSRRTHG